MMIHEKTGFFAYLVCTKCKKKTKHWQWNHEIAYHRKNLLFGLIPMGYENKNQYRLVKGYDCSICRREFNFQGKVKLLKKVQNK